MSEPDPELIIPEAGKISGSFRIRNTGFCSTLTYLYTWVIILGGPGRALMRMLVLWGAVVLGLTVPLVGRRHRTRMAPVLAPEVACCLGGFNSVR